MSLFNNVLFGSKDIFGPSVPFTAIEKILKRPIVSPRFRISVLNPDETIDYVIPNTDIPNDGISYTENYQQGQRKSMTLKLINTSGKYSLSINGIWLDAKFRLDMGVELETGEVVWFPKGVYIMGNSQAAAGNSDKTVTLTLKDKFAMFEDKRGTLDAAYEIETDSTIEDAIGGILNFDRGNGYIFDYKDIIYDESFRGKKTQSTIRVEEGGNLGTLIKELATQLSAEYYYNNVGNLCFVPLNETINDGEKPVVWVFANNGRDLHNIELSYNNDEVINVVKVVGTNTTYGTYAAVVSNDNITSPICVERIGRRVSKQESENIWSDDLAEDLAKYYLRLASILAVSFTMPTGFNPALSVNNICEVENAFLGMEREKLLINSITINSSDGTTSLSVANTSDLPNVRQKVGG